MIFLGSPFLWWGFLFLRRSGDERSERDDPDIILADSERGGYGNSWFDIQRGQLPDGTFCVGDSPSRRPSP